MAFTVLENISQDELNWYHESRYWMHVSDELTMKKHARREGLAEGRAEGRAEGLAEGRAEGLAEGRNAVKLETAKKLLEMGVLSNEQISQATGLSLEQIEKLK